MASDQGVHQAGREAVGQQTCGKVERRSIFLAVGGAVKGVNSDLDERDLSLDLHFADTGERLDFDRSLLRLVAAADAPEGALQQRLQPVEVNVSRQYQAHVAADIVFVEEVHHLSQTGILEVLRAADDLVGIGIAAAELLDHLEERGLYRVVGSAVLLFVNGLKFALEQAEHRIDHAVAVQFGPLLDVLGGEGIVVISIIVRCTGVEAGAAEAGDQARELVGDGEVGGFLAQAVNLFLDSLAVVVVGEGGETVIAECDGVQPDLLGLVIHGAELFRALEEQMLEIMGEARVRTVLCACSDYDRSVDYRLGSVLVEPDLHAVREFELFDFQGIVLCIEGEGKQCPGNDGKNSFH